MVYETEHVFETAAPAEFFVPIVVRRAGHSSIRVRAESLREGLSAEAHLAVTFGERDSSWGFNLPARETVEYHTLDGVWNGCTGGGIHGFAKYKDPDGNTRPVRRGLAKLFVLPNDDNPVEEEVAQMETKSDGHFYFCDIDAPEGILTVRIFAEYLTKENRGYRVKKGGETHFMTSCNACPLPGGNDTKYLGEIFPDAKKDNAGFHVFDVAMQAFDKIASDDCWGFAGQCRQMQFSWSPDGVGADFVFDPAKPEDDHIWIAGSKADYPDAIVHEIAHALKYRLYDDTGFSEEICQDHWWSKVTSPECAFEEGFAGWLPTFVFDKDDYSQDGKTQSLEKPGWKYKPVNGSEWPHGDEVEGRVAAALHDIVDGVNSHDNPGLTPWDFVEMKGVRKRIFKAMKNDKPETLKDFILALYDLVSQEPEYDLAAEKEYLLITLQAACFQNTIDYDFRNILGVLISKPMKFPSPYSGGDDFGPEVPHGYLFQPLKGWNLVALSTTTTKSLGLFEDKWLSTQIGNVAGTCHIGLPMQFPPPCGDLAFVAYQTQDAVPDRRYAEVRGHPTAEASAQPYTIVASGGMSAAPGSQSFLSDGKIVRVIELTGLTNGELASILVEPLDHQLVSIALLPAAAKAVDSHDSDIVWSFSAEADTRPIIRFTPNAPAGKTYALVILSPTPGAIAVHLDQTPPHLFLPALEFFRGNPYADPYPDFGNIVNVGGPKTKLGYTRYLWTHTPDWAQAPWQSEHTLLTYVEELTGVVGTASTARLRPTKWNGGTPEFNQKLLPTAPGSTKPLCMQILNDAAFPGQGCTTVQFPGVHPEYYFIQTTKNF